MPSKPYPKGLWTHYTNEEKDRAAMLAYSTSICWASEQTGMSRPLIAKHMRRLGLKVRRPGNYTNDELENVLSARTLPEVLGPTGSLHRRRSRLHARRSAMGVSEVVDGESDQ
jgi:hypothetical protein